MQRKWAVRPDQGDMLSRDALFAALADAAVMLDLAGGCLEVVVGRIPTGVPGEMVMNGAVLCWKDRTDAKPQAEVAVQVVATATERPEMVGPGQIEEMTEALDAENRARSASNDRPESEASREIDPADGFDYSGMPDEDLEGAPVAAR